MKGILTLEKEALSEKSFVQIGARGWRGTIGAGIPTFLMAPLVPPVEGKLREHGAKAAILGVPWEHTNPCSPGSSLGPRSLRAMSAEQYQGYLFEYDLDIIDKYKLVDCGDICIVPGNFEKTHDRVVECSLEILRAEAFPILVGGDDTLLMPGTAALSKVTKGKIGFIKFDTHMDNSEEFYMGRVVRLPNLDPKNAVIVGPRGGGNLKSWVEFNRKYGITLYSMGEVIERGIKEITEEALKIAWDGTEAVYLNFDIDVMDQAYAPGTSIPEPYGLNVREMVDAAKILGKTGINMLDIAELCPANDLHNITARLVCYLIFHILGSAARK